MPHGRSVPWENSFNRASGDKWAQGTCAGCPQQRYTTGEPGKVHGRDRVGIIEGSCGYRASGVSIRGLFVLSRDLVNKTRGRHVAKRNTCIKVQLRDIVRVVNNVAPFATRGIGIGGKFVLSSPRG